MKPCAALQVQDRLICKQPWQKHSWVIHQANLCRAFAIQIKQVALKVCQQVLRRLDVLQLVHLDNFCCYKQALLQVLKINGQGFAVKLGDGSLIALTLLKYSMAACASSLNETSSSTFAKAPKPQAHKCIEELQFQAFMCQCIVELNFQSLITRVCQETFHSRGTGFLSMRDNQLENLS